MRIGTITFHWGTNYGAVLQAYALQQYLKRSGHDTEIIDYRPLKVRQYEFLWTIVRRDFKRVSKLRKFNSFRRNHLKLSSRIFRKNSDLVKHCHNYDAYITGSDQVWNVAFTQRAEGKVTLSYYLNFVKDSKKRISYATSFGTDKLPQDVIECAKPELNKFHAISVREKTGKQIVERMGFDATITLDPTLLIEHDSYDSLISSYKPKKVYQLFSYILHDNQALAHKVKDFVFDKYFDCNTQAKYENQSISITDWLYNLKHSEVVVTNSFHGTIFALIFHKNFMVIPVGGSAMNDRITTLLDSVGLSDAILSEFDIANIERLYNKTIDWNEIDKKLADYRKHSIDFLEKSLNDTTAK